MVPSSARGWSWVLPEELRHLDDVVAGLVQQHLDLESGRITLRGTKSINSITRYGTCPDWLLIRMPERAARTGSPKDSS